MNVSSQLNCDKCVPSSVNYHYYEYLGILFNKLPSVNLIFLKNQLFKENISVDCQPLRFGASKINSSNFLFRFFEYLNLPLCNKDISVHYKSTNSTWKIWIVGFACITLICICACLGFLFRPLLKSKYNNVVMAFLIAMAVGTSIGTAILILIPDAFHLPEVFKYSFEKQIDYKWKATVIFGGVYIFFLLQRFIKWNTNGIGIRPINHHDSHNASEPQKNVIQMTIAMTVPKHLIRNVTIVKSSIKMTKPSSERKSKKKRKIASVAWMIIFGDSIHSFIDGLSIGAAFSFGIFKGISLSLAVLCEELPHELGDFAILLNSGMTIKQAFLWNLLGIVSFYPGFILGVVLGEMTSSSTWIFAVAAGMFLYISLVDMMPELNALLEKSEDKRLNIFLVQNLGFWCGYIVILVMALYGDRINIK